MRAVLVSFGLLVASLTACASHPPQSPKPDVPAGPPARVDIGRALAGHPFAPVLAQYDVDIATLRDTTGTAAFADVHDRLESSAAAIDRELIRASARVKTLRAQPIGSPLPAAAAGNGAESFGNGTLASFRDALQNRIVRAHDLRASQLREREANVALDFERAHAGQRLVLDVKLRNLHLDAQTQRAFRAQLATLDSQQSGLVNAERRRGSAVLATYDAQLRARALADAAAMSTELAESARAMQRIPRPHIGSLPASIAAGRDERPATLSAFSTARHDLTGRFGEVRAMDDRARSGARVELAALERERDDLRAQIVAAIQSRAEKIAAGKGLGRVYLTNAPSNARDITGALLRY